MVYKLRLWLVPRASNEGCEDFTITEKAPIVKVLVGAFNQEKVLVEAFSVIVKLATSRRFLSSSN